MKVLFVGLLVLAMALIISSASAADMGRLNGYTKPVGKDTSSMPLSNAVVVNEAKKISSHGRLSAYGQRANESGAKLETAPVLAGMRSHKPVKQNHGLGRLSGYEEEEDQADDYFLPEVDTTNMAIWQ